VKTEVFASVWDAIENTPAEAENMRVRAKLMREIDRHIRESGWTQVEAARRLGVTQPRISDLMRGKVDLFAIDGLVTMLAAAGMQVELRVRAA
jgi:predicted XRE-type DNA-binding protein